MKTKMALSAIRSMLLSVIVLLPLQVNFGIIPTADEGNSNANAETLSLESEIPPSAQPKVVLLDIKEEYCDTECFLKKNSQTVEFMANTFGVDSAYIYEDLIKKNEYTKYNEYNIGLIKDQKGLKEYGSFEEGLIEYLVEFTSSNPELVNNDVTPYTGSNEYIIDLIKYFAGIYTNVDYLTAVAIGAAESGYYKVNYMLASNNIYGGMSSNMTLIKYRNIEYGVLSYMRLLSRSYFGRGLTDLESIGSVYCPTYNASGQKVASSHWLYLVSGAQAYYADSYSEVSIAQLVG